MCLACCTVGLFPPDSDRSTQNIRQDVKWRDCDSKPGNTQTRLRSAARWEATIGSAFPLTSESPHWWHWRKVTHSSAPLCQTTKPWYPHPHAHAFIPSDKSFWSHRLPSALNVLPKCTVQSSPANDLFDPTICLRDRCSSHSLLPLITRQFVEPVLTTPQGSTGCLKTRWRLQQYSVYEFISFLYISRFFSCIPRQYNSRDTQHVTS
jgi:hypothetical protein